MDDAPKDAPAAPPKRGRSRRTTGSTIATGQPVVAIVGYPNVGKSTLFNRLCGRRDAVVDAMPGVTRDRRQGGCEWTGHAFQVLDTGGIDESDEGTINRQVAAQAIKGIEEADVVLLVLDTLAGARPGDLEVIERLRRSEKPVIVVANKCERPEHDMAAQAFWAFGIGDVIPISALHGLGVGDLLDAIVALLPEREESAEDAAALPAICILGRPNVGKSSILNALLGEERVLVHDRPGTTRDPVDTLITVDDQEIVLIDTAGLRKRGRMREGVEHYSQIRAIQAAERSDVAMVVCDATEGVTDSDLAAVDQAARAHCATLLVMNKWDLAQPDLDHIRGKIRAKSRQRPPIEVCSATTGEGLHRLIPAALRLVERSRGRHSTKLLNTIIRELAAERLGPRRDNRRLSLRYLVQTDVSPPRFRLDVNDPRLMTRDYGFWLENKIRQRLDLDGVPVEIDVRERR